MTNKENSEAEQHQAEEAEVVDGLSDDGDQTEQAGTEPAAAPESPDLEVLQQELNDAREEVLRTHAEMQNLRRRVERDVESAHKYALEKFVGELLPVVDNLERAIAAIPTDNPDNQAVLEGIELTLKSFSGVLEKFAVKAVDPKGEVFDPELHQAMSMQPSSDYPPNTVIEVFQKGYTLNGRLVRPAMVVVAKPV